MPVILRLLVLVFLYFTFTPVAIVNADNYGQWYLISRHGECADIKSLRRKIPDMPDIDDPYAFIALMKGRNYEVISNEMKELSGNAVSVSIAEKGLSVLFVRSIICKGFISR
ncbi:MAG: hypothetical protein EP297_03580 [Gammaproteobacteria bacterium]|nr:MAG: hypothetical protein EP297_03580 [Gammaproteobacteria bacterium]